jgi:hypothetical protein
VKLFLIAAAAAGAVLAVAGCSDGGGREQALDACHFEVLKDGRPYLNQYGWFAGSGAEFVDVCMGAKGYTFAPVCHSTQPYYEVTCYQARKTNWF